jgi:hypothetical protein
MMRGCWKGWISGKLRTDGAICGEFGGVVNGAALLAKGPLEPHLTVLIPVFFLLSSGIIFITTY